MTSPDRPDGNDDAYRTPRWVKAFGIIALILVVLLVLLIVIGGDHGPGRHTPSESGTSSGDRNPAPDTVPPQTDDRIRSDPDPFVVRIERSV